MSEDQELVDRIYEAAFIPELWPSVLERIAEFTDTFGGSIYTCGKGYSAVAASENCEQHLRDMICLGWAERNIRAQRVIASKNNSFLADHDYLTPEEIDGHPIYADFLRPRGLGWTAGTYIVGADDDFAIFSIDQLYERGPIRPEVLAYLNELRPHIARAAALATRIGREKGGAVLSQLDVLGIPACLITGDGRVQRVNSVFDSISEDILIGARDKITLKDSRLDQLFREALTDRHHCDIVRSIPILRRDGVSPAVLHVVPLRRQSRDLFSKSEFIVAVLALSKMRKELSDILSMLYDLTAAETRTVKDLCSGEDTSSISKKHNISRDTVRTQIKSVLSKTGIRKQSELISKFSNINIIHSTS